MKILQIAVILAAMNGYPLFAEEPAQPGAVSVNAELATRFAQLALDCVHWSDAGVGTGRRR